MNAMAFRPVPKDVLVATLLLSRFPLPHLHFAPDDPRPQAHAAWAYPVVGIAVGGFQALACWIALAVGLPAGTAALLALAAGILCTGAMHEDGLADCADGFWGGWSPERRLEIMKDSAIGTYGVLALLVSFGVRWVALSGLLAAGIGTGALALIGVAVVSRGCMVGVMTSLPHARTTGLSHQTGTVPMGAAWIALALSVVAAILLVPAGIVALVTLLGLVLLAWGVVARRKVGGQTGDVLGASQQVAEATALLVCLAAVT